MMELVDLFTDPGDLVLDPFAGSGTTGEACLRSGRRFLGCELDETYHATACARLKAAEQGLSLRDARAGQLSLLHEKD
jgi:site-specific DNA-methyltransferase (adenine-specific)